MRWIACVLSGLLAAACGGSPPGPSARAPGAADTAVATITLAAPVAMPADVTVAASAAQVRIVLPGVTQPADELTAELENRTSGDVRRWPVDAASAGVSVTVPAYAVAPGEHLLTVWQGDADAVARYPFLVSRP